MTSKPSAIKKSYIKTVNILFAAGLIPLAAQYLQSGIWAFLRGTFPSFFELSPFWTAFFLPNLFYIFLYTAGFLIVAAVAFGKGPGEYFAGSPVKPLTAVSYLFMFMAAATVLSYAWTMLQTLINNAAGDRVIADYTASLTMPTGTLQIIAYFFLVALLPAVCEELAMRAIFCGELAKYNEAAAIVLSGLMFALFHYTLGQLPYAFIMGVLFALIYVKTRSFALVSAIHFCNNLWGAFTMVSGTFMSAELYMTVSLSGAFIFICGGIFFAMIRRGGKGHRSAQPALSGRKAAKYTLLAPLFWATVILSLTFTVYVNYLMIR